MASQARHQDLHAEPTTCKHKRSILTKLVREECANFVNNRCLGLSVYSKPFRRPGDCRILMGKPCDYFRDAVLPLATRKGNGEAARKYAEIDHRVVMEEEHLRRCTCGAALPPRKRLCQKCALQNRRETYRKKWLKQRGNTPAVQTPQLTENSHFNSLSDNGL